MRDRTSSFTLVFFGSGEFAYHVLRSLRRRERLPRLVVTTPDRARGRGRRPEPSPVKRLALDFGLDVEEPERPSSPEFCDRVRSLAPDYILVSDYGRILRRGLLDVPRLVPLNIHPSLLPRYRGAAPIERSLMAGDRVLGVTLFIMDEGVDSGDILLSREVRIGEAETKGDLVPKLATLGTELFLEGALGFMDGTVKPTSQPRNGASYAEKIRKEEVWIDWSRTALEIANQINALSPRPGARTRLDGTLTKLLRARVEDRALGKPLEVVVRGRSLFVGASKGAVEILELQPEGGTPMSAAAYLAGHVPKKTFLDRD